MPLHRQSDSPSYKALVAVGAGVAAVLVATIVVIATGPYSHPKKKPIVTHPTTTLGRYPTTLTLIPPPVGSTVPTTPVTTQGSTILPSSSTTVAPLRFQPNGAPFPVLVVFNGPTTTITGFVPSEAADAKLAALAKAFSQDPNATVVNRMQVDFRVPLSVGVRVVDLQSPRWDSGSSIITSAHAAQFDRLVKAMKLLSNTTVTVVGHSDSTGDASLNLILSQARADAVANYLIAQGIAPNRVASQGVGSADPLTQQSDLAGLALNRRVEFVLYGLLTT